MISYAQNFEDVMLWRALGHVEAGCYLDVGAQLPIYDSVSKAFYEAGWRGVHVEATPTYAAAIRADRPDEIVIQAAVSDEPGPIRFFEIPETGLSTGRVEIADSHAEIGFGSREISVPCVSLASVLTSMSGSDIHWMKIDVEGMEAQVLRSWADCPVRPWVLVVESTYPATQTQTHGQWIDLVLARGYQEAYFDGLSRYFVAENHIDLLAAFASPPNVFDGYQVQSHHFSVQLLMHEKAKAEQEMQGKLAAISDAEQQVRAEADHLRSLAEARYILLGEREALHGLALREQAALELRIGEAETASRSALIELAEVRGALQSAMQDHVTQIAAAIGERDHARSDIEALNQRLDAAHQAHRDQIDALWRDHQVQAETFSAERNRFEQELLSSRAAFADSQDALSRSAVEIATTREALVRSEQHSAHQLQAMEACQSELNARARALSAQLRLAEMALGQIRGIRLQSWTVRLRRRLGLSASPIDDTLSRWCLSDVPSASPESNAPFLEAPVMSLTGNPYHRAESLAALCAWHDLDFVRCAYVTILGRQPDSNGEALYVSRIRQGFHKLTIIRDLRRSEEGQRHDPGIAGLDKALRRHRRGNLPIIGVMARLITGCDGNSAVERQLRITANDIGRLRDDMQLGFAALSLRLDQGAPTIAFVDDGRQSSTSAQTDHLAGTVPYAAPALTRRAQSIYAKLAHPKAG